MLELNAKLGLLPWEVLWMALDFVFLRIKFCNELGTDL